MRIAVIGSGVIGLSVAWKLSEFSDVTVVEARSGIGAGASGAALCALWAPSPLNASVLADFQRMSLLMYPDYISTLERLTGLPAGYKSCPSIEILRSEKAFPHAREKAAVGALSDLGGNERDQVLSSEELQEKEPAIREAVVGGYYTPTSALVDGDLFLAALKKACELAQVKFEFDARVDDIQSYGDDLSLVSNGKTLLAVDRVVIAAGAWSGQIVDHDVAVKPVKGQGAIIESDSKLRHLLRAQGVYVIPYGDCRFGVGATTERDMGFDESIVPEHIELLLERAVELVPDLSAYTVVRRVAGLRPVASDAPVPIIGPSSQADGVLYATGHYKTGYVCAPKTAQYIAELVQGSPRQVIEDFLPRKIGS